MPAFLTYDQAVTAKFPITAKKTVTLFNQNSLLTSYRGAVGGKIGWTNAAGATYVGMARRNGVTLIVTLLHCPALTEIDSGKALLDWGFAADGKVGPVGTLVGARPAAAPAVPAPAPARSVSAAPLAAAARPTAPGRRRPGRMQGPPAPRHSPRPASAAWRCSPRGSASPSAAATVQPRATQPRATQPRR